MCPASVAAGGAPAGPPGASTASRQRRHADRSYRTDPDAPGRGGTVSPGMDSATASLTTRLIQSLRPVSRRPRGAFRRAGLQRCRRAVLADDATTPRSTAWRIQFEKSCPFASPPPSSRYLLRSTAVARRARAACAFVYFSDRSTHVRRGRIIMRGSVGRPERAQNLPRQASGSTPYAGRGRGSQGRRPHPAVGWETNTPHQSQEYARGAAA